MVTRDEALGFLPQRENAYNKFLPRNETLDKESGYDSPFQRFYCTY